MIVRINGGPDISQGAAQAAGEAVINFVIDALQSGAAYLVQQLTVVMPSLAVFGVCVCLTIGMFGSFGKWAARAAMVYAGGAVWIILSSV